MASPIHTGRTPELLSRATRRPAIRARYDAQGGDPLAIQRVHPTSSSFIASESASNHVHQSFSIIDSVLLPPPEPPKFLTVISTLLDMMSSGSDLGHELYTSNAEQSG